MRKLYIRLGNTKTDKRYRRCHDLDTQTINFEILGHKFGKQIAKKYDSFQKNKETSKYILTIF